MPSIFLVFKIVPIFVTSGASAHIPSGHLLHFTNSSVGLLSFRFHVVEDLDIIRSRSVSVVIMVVVVACKSECVGAENPSAI